jgi:hypothetical protein
METSLATIVGIVSAAHVIVAILCYIFDKPNHKLPKDKGSYLIIEYGVPRTKPIFRDVERGSLQVHDEVIATPTTTKKETVNQEAPLVRPREKSILGSETKATKIEKVKSVSQYFGRKGLFDNGIDEQPLTKETEKSLKKLQPPPKTPTGAFRFFKKSSSVEAEDPQGMSGILSSTSIVAKSSGTVNSGNMTAEEFFTKIEKMASNDEDNFLPLATPDQIPLKISSRKNRK